MKWSGPGDTRDFLQAQYPPRIAGLPWRWIPSRATEVKTSPIPRSSPAWRNSSKGETTVKIGALAERYCQRCGTKMGTETIICPNCRQSPPSRIKITTVSVLQGELPRSAMYCNTCGRKPA